MSIVCDEFIPDILDITAGSGDSVLLTKDFIVESVTKHQCVYIRTGFGDNPGLLVGFFTLANRMGVDLRVILEVAERCGQDLLFIGQGESDRPLIYGVKDWNRPLVDCAKAIERFAKSKDKEFIDTIGYSIGASSALMVASEISVRRSLLFNPVTIITQSDLDIDDSRAEFIRNTWKAVVEDNALDLPYEERLTFGLNMRVRLERSRFKDNKYYVVTSDVPFDKMHGRNIASVPNVFSRACLYKKHSLPAYLFQENLLKPLMLKVFGRDEVDQQALDALL